MHEVHKKARELAGTSVGPSRRFYNIPNQQRCELQDWADHLANTGAAGGMSCSVMDDLQDRPPPRRSDITPELVSLMNTDYKDMRQSFIGMSNGKSTVPWGVPTEFWKMVLYPATVWSALRSSVAVTGDPPKGESTSFTTPDWIKNSSFAQKILDLAAKGKQLDFARAVWNTVDDQKEVLRIPEGIKKAQTIIKSIFKVMRMTTTTPLFMLTSWMFFLDKANGKRGPSGQRALHRMDPLCKAHGKATVRRGPEADGYVLESWMHQGQKERRSYVSPTCWISKTQTLWNLAHHLLL
jgi:hypothetical protein